MAKSYAIIAIIGVTLALVAAEPPRFRQSMRLGNLEIQNNRKLFARQEQAPDARTPYPPAGVTPEIPFDLPTETEAPLDEPDQTYGPPEPTPDVSYLPPEPKPDQTYGPPESTPDETYGPPEAGGSSATTNDHPAIEELETEELPPSESNLVSENIVQPRNKFRAPSRSAQLRSRNRFQRSPSPALQFRRAPVQLRSNSVEMIHSEPVLIYTLL